MVPICINTYIESKIHIVTSAVVASRYQDIDTSEKLIEFSGQREDQRKGAEMTSRFVEAIVRTSWLQSLLLCTAGQATCYSIIDSTVHSMMSSTPLNQRTV